MGINLLYFVLFFLHIVITMLVVYDNTPGPVETIETNNEIVM